MAGVAMRILVIRDIDRDDSDTIVACLTSCESGTPTPEFLWDEFGATVLDRLPPKGYLDRVDPTDLERFVGWLKNEFGFKNAEFEVWPAK